MKTFRIFRPSGLPFETVMKKEYVNKWLPTPVIKTLEQLDL